MTVIFTNANNSHPTVDSDCTYQREFNIPTYTYTNVDMTAAMRLMHWGAKTIDSQMVENHTNDGMDGAGLIRRVWKIPQK